MAKAPSSDQVSRKTYRGYTLRVTTPSRTAYSAGHIRRALSRFTGMKIIVTSGPNSARPRINSLDIPARSQFGKVFKDGKEIPGYSEDSLWAEIQRTLSRMKPTA